MRKYRFFALVFCVMLSVTGFAPAEEEKTNFFFSAGFYSGFFADSPFRFFPDLKLKNLSFLKISGNWERPVWIGNVSWGFEAGYSSGSRFGGQGGVDFIPVLLTTAYKFPFIDGIFSVGPSLKLGGIAMVHTNWFRTVPLVGARLETEFRIPRFPIGLYAAGGFDLFPRSSDFLPVVELGLRFRRRTLQPPRVEPAQAQELTEGLLISTGETFMAVIGDADTVEAIPDALLLAVETSLADYTDAVAAAADDALIAGIGITDETAAAAGVDAAVAEATPDALLAVGTPPDGYMDAATIPTDDALIVAAAGDIADTPAAAVADAVADAVVVEAAPDALLQAVVTPPAGYTDAAATPADDALIAGIGITDETAAAAGVDAAVAAETTPDALLLGIGTPPAGYTDIAAAPTDDALIAGIDVAAGDAPAAVGDLAATAVVEAAPDALLQAVVTPPADYTGAAAIPAEDALIVAAAGDIADTPAATVADAAVVEAAPDALLQAVVTPPADYTGAAAIFADDAQIAGAGVATAAADDAAAVEVTPDALLLVAETPPADYADPMVHAADDALIAAVVVGDAAVTEATPDALLAVGTPPDGYMDAATIPADDALIAGVDVAAAVEAAPDALLLAAEMPPADYADVTAVPADDALIAAVGYDAAAVEAAPDALFVAETPPADYADAVATLADAAQIADAGIAAGDAPAAVGDLAAAAVVEAAPDALLQAVVTPPADYTGAAAIHTDEALIADIDVAAGDTPATAEVTLADDALLVAETPPDGYTDAATIPADDALIAGAGDVDIADDTAAAAVVEATLADDALIAGVDVAAGDTPAAAGVDAAVEAPADALLLAVGDVADGTVATAVADAAATEATTDALLLAAETPPADYADAAAIPADDALIAGIGVTADETAAAAAETTPDVLLVAETPPTGYTDAVATLAAAAQIDAAGDTADATGLPADDALIAGVDAAIGDTPATAADDAAAEAISDALLLAAVTPPSAGYTDAVATHAEYAQIAGVGVATGDAAIAAVAGAAADDAAAAEAAPDALLLAAVTPPAGHTDAAQAQAFADKSHETAAIPGRVIVLEEGVLGHLSSIHFEPDTAVLLEAFRPTLEAVGRHLAENPEFNILLRAYTAPFGTFAGRRMVSEARAAFSRDYLIQNFGISADRITTEAHGSERIPEIVTSGLVSREDWVSFRCVELIIIPITKS